MMVASQALQDIGNKPGTTILAMGAVAAATMGMGYDKADHAVDEFTSRFGEAIRGSRFNDILIGDSGNNRLRGENGDDFLEGKEGNDYLLGGQGADIFNYQLDMENGNDTIGDFDIYEDKIKITSNASLTFLEIKSSITSNPKVML
ncbi:hypothetical protein NOVO_01900 [Rickettsiales bacterium Ac37b]|nr:hypothetical protein NOVO_01900 [Rickettsiales bacterium Ac37b]